MRKFFSLIAAVLFAGSMMADNYVPVTDASTLAAGDQIIITDVDAAAAISTTQNNNNRGVTTVALTDGVIVPGENVQIITLVAAEANFMFQVGEDAYLYAASNSSNHLKTATAATVGDNGKFAISIDGTGVASVIAQGTNSRNDLRYNPSSSCFSCYGSSTSVEAGLKIFKKEGGVTPPTPTMNYYVTGNMTSWAPKANYMLTPDNGGLYKGEFTFAANDEFKVSYSDGTTIDDANWFPTGMNNNYVITEAGDYTITFNPAGNVEGWYEGYFQVLKKEVPVLPIYTCAQVQANQATETGELNEVQVLFVNGGQFYVRDASGMTLIYKSSHGLAIGNLVSGIVGTSTLYNNVTPQFQPSNAVTDWTITEGSAPVYDVKAVAPVTADVNGVYNFTNVVFAEAVEFTTSSKGSAVTATIGEGNITIFNNYKKAFSFEANKAYDVLGVVTIYQNNPQVYFVSAAKHTATAIDNAAIETKAIKTIENGKLVIIKNGVRYDALGTRL